MVKLRGILFIVVFFGLVFQSFCQEEDIFGITRKARPLKSESKVGNAFRSIQELFSFQVASGGAYYAMNTSFYKGDGQLYPITHYQNADYEYFPLPDTLSLQVKQVILPTIEVGVRMNVLNLLTLGAGYGWESTRLAPFEGNGYQFALQGTSIQATNYYASLGLVLFDATRRRFLLKQKYKRFNQANPDLKMRMQREYNQRIRQNYPWTVSVEGEVGRLNLIQNKQQLATTYQAKLSSLSNQFTYAGVIRVGYQLSEYASIFVKGKYMQRSFVNGSSDFSPFPMDQVMYSLQAGITMKVPGTKRCKINGCGVVMKHRHNGIEYRGSSIFNLQNRKIGQWY
uniref:hypothetical protein n=1 Tax=Algoriphagus sp. TaxID=1872435 RepID=UPI00404754F9